jgi:hypothetical protein
MSFEKPIVLFREGIGNINYGSPGGAGSGSGVFAGARNGVSQDPSNFVVLGQAVGGGGGALLNDRQIPMAGFYVNLFGGDVGFGDEAVPGSPMFLQRAIAAGVDNVDSTDNFILFNPTPSVGAAQANSPAIVFSCESGTNLRFKTQARCGSGTGILIDLFSNDGGVTYTEVARMVDDGTFVAAALVGDVSTTTPTVLMGEVSIGTQGAFNPGEAGLSSQGNPVQFNIFNTITGIAPDSTYASMGWTDTPNYFTFGMKQTGTGPLGLGYLFSSQVGIGGTSIDGAALLELDSTTQGLLLPRMTTTEKNNIVSPPDGLFIYDTVLNKACLRAGGAWETVTSI